MKQKLSDWRVKRNRALATLDMDYARREMPAASSDEVRLMAMHKARVECADIDSSLRLPRVKWLQERKLGRIGPLDWIIEWELPE